MATITVKFLDSGETREIEAAAPSADSFFNIDFFGDMLVPRDVDGYTMLFGAGGWIARPTSWPNTRDNNGVDWPAEGDK